MNKPLHHILIRPLLTEKSVSRTQPNKHQKRIQYLFVVANDATKTEIKQAVETLYAKEKVQVASVNTLHMRGKTRRMNMRRARRPSVGTTPSWKKAVVTLAPDSPTIPMLEGV